MTAHRATIGAWLSQEEGAQFKCYANEIGLDVAALAMILIVRELNHDRLPALKARGLSSRAGKGQRVSGRTANTALKARFADHAIKYDLSSDAAAQLLFRAELSEGWLGCCLGIT